jgi:hypothetical protein
MVKKNAIFPFLQISSKSSSKEPGAASHVNLAPTLLDPTLLEDAPDSVERAAPLLPSPQLRPNYLKMVTGPVTSGAKYLLQGMAQAVDYHKVSLLWLGFIALVGGAGIGASLWLSQVPPPADCQKISAWSADAERLYCAEQAAQSGTPEKIVQSMQLVKDWSATRPLYPQAQSLLQNWSNALLLIARERINQRDLRGAVALANQIPPSSPMYKDAQTAIGRWKEEWNRGQRLYDKIQAALEQQNWNKASDSLAKLAMLTDPVWQERVSELRGQMIIERRAWQALQDARAFAKNNPPEKLGQAMAMADTIGHKTLVWQKAEADVLQWRNSIFDLAAAKLAKREVVAASALINSVPASVQVTAIGQDITRLVRASEAELAQDNRIPTLDQAFPLLTALHSVQQIEGASPFYKPAQKLITRLEAQVQDLLQLQTAGMLANFGQLATLQAAIAQAKLVQPGRPRRLHAQTLVAEWQQNLQRLEDRPTLRQAQQWSKAGSLPQLRSAVALANQIPKNRSLYPEAQTQVGQWTAQIQTIEDRPILLQAQALANQGRLEQAIAAAGRIRPGRALYGEAQNDAGGWIAQLQAIADRGTLDQAIALAEQGALSRAIDLASSISYGRSLYREAQGAIARWADQRAVILRAREPSSAPGATPDPTLRLPDSTSGPNPAAATPEPARASEPEPPSPDPAPPALQ